mgnify:CR=1 FL=1
MSHTTYRIYLATNMATGMQYVGVTSKAVSERMYWHYHTGISPMYADMRSQGFDTFKVVVLKRVTDRAAALTYEADMIGQLNTHAPHGYNRQVRGGQYPGRGGPRPGNKNSRRRPVLQLAKDGEVITRHPTVMDAAKALGIQRNTIHRAIINPSYTAGGFKWSDA